MSSLLAGEDELVFLMGAINLPLTLAYVAGYAALGQWGPWVREPIAEGGATWHEVGRSRRRVMYAPGATDPALAGRDDATRKDVASAHATAGSKKEPRAGAA